MSVYKTEPVLSLLGLKKKYITSYSKIRPESSLTDSDTKLRAETGSNAEAITKRRKQKENTL